MNHRAAPRHRNPAAAGFALCAALFLALLLGGCAAPPQTAALHAQWPAGVPERALLAEVPFFAQEDHQCGPAALAMLLQSAGVKATPEQLLPQVYLPGREGSLQLEMIVAARRNGLPAYKLAPRLDALLAELAAGHPVLVLQNLSLEAWPVWHYAVAIGFDRAAQTVTLHSGRTARLEMSLATFERTWARGGHWAIVATMRPPATAEAATMAAAIAALERLDARAARRAYASALGRWPADPVLLLGAGNTAYAAGDLRAAAAAYRGATEADPRLADAWNNLAQVLMERGDRPGARAAIARAIALGGPRLSTYRELEQQLRRK